jgi:6-phosphogluconolactonase (cycloisomerase 2 family)
MPRLHDIIADPSGHYILIPNLEANSVRIFPIPYEPETLQKLFEAAPLKLTPRSGPLHGIFVKFEDQTYFYILNQTSNTLVRFRAKYPHKALEFQQVSEINIMLRLDGSFIKIAPMASELQVSVWTSHFMTTLSLPTSIPYP